MFSVKEAVVLVFDSNSNFDFNSILVATSLSDNILLMTMWYPENILFFKFGPKFLLKS